jgi:hypothetical protein
MPPLGAPPPPDDPLLPELPCTADSLQAAAKSVANTMTSSGFSHVARMLEVPLRFMILRLLVTMPGGDFVDLWLALKGPISLGLSNRTAPEFRLILQSNPCPFHHIDTSDDNTRRGRNQHRLNH